MLDWVQNYGKVWEIPKLFRKKCDINLNFIIVWLILQSYRT